MRKILLLLLIQTIFSVFEYKGNLKAKYNIEKLEADLIDMPDIVNIRCFFVKGKNVYSFNNLEKDSGDYNHTFNNGSFYYNFCKNTQQNCNETKDGKTVKKADSTLVYIKDQKCTRLSGPIEGTSNSKNVWEEFSTTEKVGNTTKTTTGLKLTLAKGDICESDQNYQIVYQITCNSNRTEKNQVHLNFSAFNFSSCTNTIYGSSYDACSVSNVVRLLAFFEDNKIIVGICLILLGLVFVGMGGKLFKMVVVLICGIGCAALVSVIVFNFVTVDTQQKFWIIILVPFGVGIAIGLLLLKCIKIAFFVNGALFGNVVGMFMYNLVLKFVSWNPQVVYYLVMAVCMIAFGILALYFLKLFIIISSAFVGGYFVVKGASLYIGKFPDETEVFEYMINREYEQLLNMLTPHAYIYIGVWVVLALIGIAIQCRLTKGTNNSHYSGDGREYKKL